ncbi:FAD/NAD(P)-binding domain-containing protein [Penicillium coprophilum]|uniref:FAD/NAD(P)-binding domain-containing protein n=1 Tax=Penicillium coprophilum TaxID=36646 RepID=UPI002399D29B|nr:FAD/NAD(P)-binding domain-containing protein [Penicillium coprophilum]KAJ5177692.1 FAD/NAD(P)-binding domain-containing protein [Penicillium coprophilum]
MPLLSKPPSSVIIIGGGFSGLAMACQLQRTLDLDDYVIYDRNSGIGGTWWANTCSFIPPPEFSLCLSSANRDLCAMEQIQDVELMFRGFAIVFHYMHRVASHYGVSDHFTGNTEWEGADWQDEKQLWLVRLKDLQTGDQFTQECRILISGVGALVNPRTMDVEGSETFQGSIIHTAQWQHSVDLRDKHVSGEYSDSSIASALQLVPEIAKEAKSVTQFMRSPQHLVESSNYAISPFWRFMFRYFPITLYLARFVMFIYMEESFLHSQPSRPGRLSRANSERQSREYVQRTAPKKYWDLLTPTFDFGCRVGISTSLLSACTETILQRRIFDRAYAASLHQDNLTLTNDPIVKIKPTAIVTGSKEEVYTDVIVLATGFDLSQYDIEIKGRHGKTREQHWQEAEGKATFKTVAMSGFPNFFYILGPNSGRIYTSTLAMIESQVDLVINAIRPIILRHASSVEVRTGRDKQYQDSLNHALDNTIYNRSCSGYFFDEGTGKNWFIYPWDSVHLWWEMYWNAEAGWEYHT